MRPTLFAYDKHFLIFAEKAFLAFQCHHITRYAILRDCEFGRLDCRDVGGASLNSMPVFSQNFYSMPMRSSEIIQLLFGRGML